MDRRDGRPAGLSIPDALVLGAAVGVPWFWGGMRLDVFRTASAVIAVAACWALIRHGAAGLGLRRGWSWMLPAFLLAVWALAQAAPMPRAWVAILSPKSAALQEEAFGPEGLSGDAWLRRMEGEARARVPEAPSATAAPAGALAPDPGVSPPARRFTLSLHPSVTLERALWYGALLLAFLLVRCRTAGVRRSDAYRAVLFGMFVSLAVVSCLNRLTAPDRFMWVRDMPAGVQAIGPYVDPSHLAGAMELAVPWMLGYGIFTLRRRRESAGGVVPGILAILGAAICGATALLAASKMAALTILIGSIVVVAVAAARATRRWALLAGAAAMTLVLVAVAAYGPLGERIADFRAEHSGALATNVRGIAWNAGLRMGRDFMLTGSGFGAFPEVFPAYLPFGEREIWFALHNDYLEVYLAGGAVAVALVLWLAAGFVIRAVRAVRIESTRGRLLPALGLAVALLALAVHEAVDFNLQIPANALLFVVLAAIATSPAVAEEATS